ncbi:CBO0543 family protein [Niallia nealsonii]|uniref:Uncharacterized protein n=1 Tax=Niallia nealsonii TaxID=115979 RepID=A0A2N0Z3A2_9BACI|nr:CBO0543 family protein [Niallia nealsonii]PKG23988.1 hypothetical protein CWS01_09490 [Niallia nealsonii]
MAEIIGVTIWIAAAIKWGDWRNWQKYYPTILYFIFCDVMYYYLTASKPLWMLRPTWPLQHSLISLIGEFIVFASTVLIFLGRYPFRPFISISWTFIWVIIYTINEWVLLKTGTFTHHNSWTLVDSFFFNILMFVFLRLHEKKPLMTLLLSIPIGFLVMYIYFIPIR